MPNANDKIDTFIVEQVTQARSILDGVIQFLEAGASPTAKAPTKPREQKSTAAVDFSIPLRAFVKKHSAGMSGAKKFTLLVAYLAKGNLQKDILLTDVEAIGIA
jgi:hypothetical protein